MKKRYTKAEMEIIEFDTEDVIQTSKKGTGIDYTEEEDGNVNIGG